MATSDFLPFAGDPAANVMQQSDYAAPTFTTRVVGFQTGTALSVQLNKVWRQASLISATIGQFITDETGQDSVDDGSTAGMSTLLANFKNAVRAAGASQVTGAYLPLAGGTLTGPLIVNSGPVQVNLARAAGQIAALQGSTGTAARWQNVLGSAEPEQGNNSGSNFAISRFADAGTLIDSPMTINRANGIVNFLQTPTVQGVPIGEPALEYYVRGVIFQNAIYLPDNDVVTPLPISIPLQPGNWEVWGHMGFYVQGLYGTASLGACLPIDTIDGGPNVWVGGITGRSLQISQSFGTSELIEFPAGHAIVAITAPSNLYLSAQMYMGSNAYGYVQIFGFLAARRMPPGNVPVVSSAVGVTGGDIVRNPKTGATSSAAATPLGRNGFYQPLGKDPTQETP